MALTGAKGSQWSAATLSVLGLALVVYGCVDRSAGVASSGIGNAQVNEAFIPLRITDMVVFEHQGAALVVAPGVAVTNAHNANLIPEGSLLARSRDYDLLFFRTRRTVVPPMARPYVGEPVVAYGEGSDADLREAKGVVRRLDELVEARCPDCALQHTVTFDADAGPGFSGGPVVDAKTGAVVGIVFGYRDGEGVGGGRRMFAYDIDLVLSQMRALVPGRSADSGG